jgi:hypothetical protein
MQIEPSTNIRILRLNVDKTHRVSGSFTEFQVYFELSSTPSAVWSGIFGREWYDLNPVQEASIDGSFLVIQCPLLKIVFHLPVIKRAVAATNEAYDRYAREQKREQEGQGDGRKEDRRILEELKKFLNLGWTSSTFTDQGSPMSMESIQFWSGAGSSGLRLSSTEELFFDGGSIRTLALAPAISFPEAKSDDRMPDWPGLAEIPERTLEQIGE